MATVLEYAYLSSDVYTTDEDGIYIKGNYTPQDDAIGAAWIGLPNKLEKNHAPPPAKDAFFARLYANTFTNETVIAYRGTVPNPKYFGDFVADAELTVKRWSSQDEQARNFYQWAKQYLNNQNDYSKFPSLTGHSLGGYLAQIIAVEHPGILAIVFNAPGIGDFNDPYVGHINPNNSIYKNYIYNFDLTDDSIHTDGTLIGNTQILPGYSSAIFVKKIFFGTYTAVMVDAYYSAYKEHAIASVIESLENNVNIANLVINK